MICGGKETKVSDITISGVLLSTFFAFSLPIVTFASVLDMCARMSEVRASSVDDLAIKSSGGITTVHVKVEVSV